MANKINQEINQKTKQGLFRTSDLYLASFLIMCGANIKGIDFKHRCIKDEKINRAVVYMEKVHKKMLEDWKHSNYRKYSKIRIKLKKKLARGGEITW